MADGTVKDIEDEIPFELPEGWAWCRLGEIFFHTTGKALKKSNAKGTLRKYITTSNLYWDSFDFTEVREMYFTDEELEKCTIKKGDLVLCNGGDVGRAAIWNYDEDICYQNHVSRLRPKSNGIKNRLYLYLLMLYKEQGLLGGKGIGITSLSANDLLSALFPLPPINEQGKIVAEIERIFTLIDSLESEKQDLQVAIKQAKSKILDLAIHGKLVPQDSSDEPASVLLEKLRAEKEAKIKAGELKRYKNDSYIYKSTTDNCHFEKFADGTETDIEAEIPFDIPESWAWTKIRCVSSEILYGVSESAKETGKYKLLRITDIQDDKVNWDSVPFTDYPEEKVTNYFLKNGDIVFARTGATVGKSYLVENLTVESIYASYLIRIRTSQVLNQKYIKYYFGSQTYWNQITDKSSGIGQPNVNGTSLANLYIPLPPLAEQKRIVEKIENAFAKLDFIAEQLA